MSKILIVQLFSCLNDLFVLKFQGIHQTVNPDHLGVLVDAVHESGFEIRK